MIEFASNFLSIEGIDGSGKSTALSQIKEFIPVNVEVFHDPDIATDLGNLINGFIGQDCDSRVSTLLYAASSISKQKEMNLNFKDYMYLSDRCAISTFVYSLEYGLDYLTNVHTNYIYPKNIIYLSIDPHVAFKRLKSLNDSSADLKKLNYLINNYNIVLDHFRSYGMKVHIIDASKNSVEVASDILKIIRKELVI